MHLQHRTGTYRIALSSDKASYNDGDPVNVTISIVNLGKLPLNVDPDAVAAQFTLSVIGPNFKVIDGAKVAPNDGRLAIKPGDTFTFPTIDLQNWLGQPLRPGLYSLDVSYGDVDSNVLTFWIVK